MYPSSIAKDPAKILIGLLKLLLTHNIQSKVIIEYIEHYHININTYLPALDGYTQIPLIYYCCSNPALSDLFIYLIDHNVVLNTNIISDNPEQQIDLLYYSQTQYIPLLIENGCKLNPTQINDSVEKLLIKGNIIKLITLYKHGALCKEQITKVIQDPNIIFKTLDNLYEKIYHISRDIRNVEKFNKLYDDIMKNYINTFKFFFKNGVSINRVNKGETFVQKVLNTYCIPLIQFVFEHNPNLETEELIHYSNFELTNRQVMQFIYNKHNYELIDNYLKDKLTPKKINIKKTLPKKTIKI